MFGSRSGQFFSLITIFMVMPILALTVSFTGSLSGYGEEIGSLVRLKSAYYYYNSVDSDLLRAGNIVGKRSVVAALKHVIEGGEGLDNSRKVLRELFENGTINGTEISMMNRSTIYEWLNTTENISRTRGYVLDLKLRNFSDDDIYMKTPFRIAFGLNYSLKLSDRNRFFSLEKNMTKDASVSLEGMEDPLITLNTGGRLVYPIEKAPFEYLTKKLATGNGNNSWSAGDAVILPSDEGIINSADNKGKKVLVINSSVSSDLMNKFAGVVVRDDVGMSGVTVPYVVDTGGEFYDIRNNTRVVVEGNESEVWEIENLYSTWKNSYYTGGDGPSFLGRLENNISSAASFEGLNVLLKKEDLEDVGLEVKDRSNLAHIYFSDKTTVSYKVKGMPDSFRVDQDHTDVFGVNNTLSFW